MSEKNEHNSPLAVVLLSGGLDSATTLAISHSEGFTCHAISFDYGQRHKFELRQAALVAQSQAAASHRIIRIDLSAAGGFGASALTDNIAVPKDRHDTSHGSIPVTYVPARNTIFLSFALGYAEVIGAYDIFLGVNAVDYSGYPDCRPAFITAFEKLANLATAAAVEGRGQYRIHAPLINLTKAQIIRKGLELGVDYSITHSCYSPSADGRACGHCDACVLRREGFATAGVNDPTKYA